MKKLITSICVFASSMGMAQDNSISGFSEKTVIQQKKLESQFDELLSAKRIGESIKELSAKPHHIGSAGGNEVAQKILEKFIGWGWDAKIETYQVLFPTPKMRVLEMIQPKVYKALLKEPALKEDATSAQEGQLPTYNAWSADGDVTGELVFVNYGLPDDYEQLEKMGISVKGKIAIAKYGRSWRGIKPKVAQEHGAIGCIIYSDPKDDGYIQGEVYPKGAFKNEYGVQRGSVMDMVIYPGDPLTPNIGATENALRINRLEAPNLLKIPVLPISYHDAKPLLAALDGVVAPPAWAGALPITYHIGGTPTTKVHLKLLFDWKLHPAKNVIATIKGSEYPDEWIVRGNHHDAWVNGANDPISGMAAELEEAKAIGVLLKTGWRPKRTLVYCAWDAEEPGLMGSTEWVEDHAAELQQKCVVYINSDSNGKGFLHVEGSHALQEMITEISKEVKDPQTNVSVFERAKARLILNAIGIKDKKEALAKKDFEIGAMGSGSDYSSFIQHLGIPALNIEFGGEDAGGEYHSIYDSYDHYKQFKDPSFEYGVALAKTTGRTVLRMANASLLPFNFSSLHTTMNGYVKELISKIEQMREATVIDQEIEKAGSIKLAGNPKYNTVITKAPTAVPIIDFSYLQKALIQFGQSVDQLNKQLNTETASESQLQKLNILLYKAEQQLLLEKGLPRRSWYKHSLYAPGFYTGYGVKTMPGIREAIEQRNWKEAEEQIQSATTVIQNLAAYLIIK
ncbi:MAG: M28 family peptidase [Sphingobacteriia bacterium]|nr:MAG: M28 family peptidase [Sphingobacteriia bacterium]